MMGPVNFEEQPQELALEAVSFLLAPLSTTLECRSRHMLL